MRILGVGSEIVLDERRQRGLGQVPVTIDTGVDKKVNVFGRSTGPLETGLAPTRRRGEVRCAGCATHRG